MTEAAARISIGMDPAAVAEVQALLSALEHASELVRDEFFGLIDGLLSRLSECDLTLAPIAGKDVLRLELPAGWIAELRAATARARQIDSFCAHGGPHAK